MAKLRHEDQLSSLELEIPLRIVKLDCNIIVALVPEVVIRDQFRFLLEVPGATLLGFVSIEPLLKHKPIRSGPCGPQLFDKLNTLKRGGD